SVKLRFFAKSKELVGCSEADIALDRDNFATGASLKDQICTFLAQLNGCFVLSVNQEYVHPEDCDISVKSGDELAISTTKELGPKNTGE
uniref:Molybdopterin synthase sulfur carrier subunit n=1 Tax=Macrostomum lignano TaxID=282301 RepID=A0A1I8F2D8_9PLAT